MRKTLLSLALLFCVSSIFAQESKIDWNLGLGGGLHLSSMDVEDRNEINLPDKSMLSSGLFSVFGEAEFGSKKQFAVRSQLSLLRRGGNFDNIRLGVFDIRNSNVDEAVYQMNVKYLDLRLPFMYQFRSKDYHWRPYAFVQPILGFVVGGNISTYQHYTTDNSYQRYELPVSSGNVNSIYFAVGTGVGMKYQFKVNSHNMYVGAELAYELGLTNTFSSKETEAQALVNTDFFKKRSNKASKRTLSGMELQFTLGVPVSIFCKRQPSKPVVKEVPKPEPKKSCYTIDEIEYKISHNQSVKGLTICAIGDINFNTNESTLKKSSYAYLDRLANTLKQIGAEVEIKGHTDNVGTDEFNMELSRNRAITVMDYLISQGVSKRKLSYSYYGKSQPLTTNDTESGRAMNRRVEFSLSK